MASTPANLTPKLVSRMIEERKHVLLRPGPVIGLVGAQIYHTCVNDPQCRHRDDQHRNGKQLPKGKTIRFGSAVVGRSNRHGAFSPTPIEVSTCSPSLLSGERRNP